MASSRHENVNKLLQHYDKCQKRVDSYKTIIREFLETLQTKYNEKQNSVIKIHKFYRVGSSYEDTVVHHQADFDIGMVLSCPVSMDSFTAKKTDDPGLYFLKQVPESSFALPDLLNPNNFLKVKELKTKICTGLLSVLKSMSMTQGFKIRAQQEYSGIKVELKKLDHDTLKMDIIPQIEGDPLNDLPDWNGENFPKFIKDIIDEKHLGVYFTLSAPPGYKKNKNKKKNRQGGGIVISGCGPGSSGNYDANQGGKNKKKKKQKNIVQDSVAIIEKQTPPNASNYPKKNLNDCKRENIDVKDIAKRLGAYSTVSAVPGFITASTVPSFTTASAVPGFRNGHGGSMFSGESGYISFGVSNSNQTEKKKKKRKNKNKKPKEKKENLIVQASFTVIEKEILRNASDTVVDAVRICKGLLSCNKSLKKGGLRNFQIKRVAMQHMNEIDRTKDSWDAYQVLMKKYIQMLLSGGVDGYLIKDQDCFFKGEEKCEQLGKLLQRVFLEIGPQNIFQRLVTDQDFYRSSE